MPYDSNFRPQVEEFRKRCLGESSGSLTEAKFNPDKLSGRILLCFLAGELVSLSAAEASHYTGDAELACRICRYHVLAGVRKTFPFFGFRMLRDHCLWAIEAGYKVVYWTHDVTNRPLNALYQKRRKYALGADSSWFEDEHFKSFQLHTSYLFKDSPNSEMRQFIYYRTLEPGYQWHPKAGVIPIDPLEMSQLVQRGSRRDPLGHQG